jgi:hypothetical protein
MADQVLLHLLKHFPGSNIIDTVTGTAYGTSDPIAGTEYCETETRYLFYDQFGQLRHVSVYKDDINHDKPLHHTEHNVAYYKDFCHPDSEACYLIDLHSFAQKECKPAKPITADKILAHP